MTEGVIRNEKKPKPPGVFGFFKAAMLVLRHRTTKRKQKAAQGDWKKLVGSMRPLHLQDNDDHNNMNRTNTLLYCATSPSAASSGTISQYASADDLKALDDTPASSGTMSQYASANNLQELDQQQEEDDPDQVFDSIGADDMIDAKAELFIRMHAFETFGHDQESVAPHNAKAFTSATS